tara:strand:- start:56 stop:439 length:384 start_codon:yes stop_codon:yes gene_type:complete
MSMKTNPKWLKMEAIEELCKGCSYSYEEHSDTLNWSLKNNVERPSDESIELKRQELISSYPIKILREHRDRLLQETDWWTLRESDGVVMTQEQKDYRKALRDLPSTANPDVDDRLKLINVSWPTKPE